MKIPLQDLDDYLDERPVKQKMKRKKPRKTDSDEQQEFKKAS